MRGFNQGFQISNTSAGSTGLSWITTYLVDYSALATQSMLSDTTHVVDGINIVIAGSANASSLGVVNGTGLRCVVNSSSAVSEKADITQFIPDWTSSTRSRISIDITGTSVPS